MTSSMRRRGRPLHDHRPRPSSLLAGSLLAVGSSHCDGVNAPAPNATPADYATASPAHAEARAAEGLLNEARRGGGKGAPYETPTEEEAHLYGAWVGAVLGGSSAVPPPGFFQRSVPGTSDLIALLETPERRRGGGAVVVRMGKVRRLLIEAPHTFFDIGTLPIAASIFETTGARALLVNTVHRYTSPGCAPGGSDGQGDCPSDVAHAPVSMFLGAHRALVGMDPEVVTVQIHGFGSHTLSGVDVVLSAAETDVPLGPIAERLKLALPGFVVRTFPAEVNKLGAIANVEAKACRAQGARFLHVELSRALRDRLRADLALLERVGEAVRSLVPAP